MVALRAKVKKNVTPSKLLGVKRFLIIRCNNIIVTCESRWASILEIQPLGLKSTYYVYVLSYAVKIYANTFLFLVNYVIIGHFFFSISSFHWLVFKIQHFLYSIFYNWNLRYPKIKLSLYFMCVCAFVLKSRFSFGRLLLIFWYIYF